jgi:hypothetical protein
MDAVASLSPVPEPVMSFSEREYRKGYCVLFWLRMADVPTLDNMTRQPRLLRTKQNNQDVLFGNNFLLPNRGVSNL